MPIDTLNWTGFAVESKDPLHLGWLEILSYQFANGRHRSKTASTIFIDQRIRQHRAGSLPDVGEWRPDSRAANSTRLTRKTGDMTLMYKFTDVVVTVTVKCPSPGGRPGDSVYTLNFKKFEMPVGVPDAQPRGGQAGRLTLLRSCATKWRLKSCFRV